jgi:hypothetical protein
MNKEQLLALRDLIDAEIQEIDFCTPEPEGHPDVFTPERGDDFYTILQSFDDGGFTVTESILERGHLKNVFRTEEAAQEFAFGLEVMMRLRGCRGAKRFEGGKANRYIGLFGGQLGIYCVENDATDCILGCFNTEENAQAALATVGEDAILRAIAGLV